MHAAVRVCSRKMVPMSKSLWTWRLRGSWDAGSEICQVATSQANERAPRAADLTRTPDQSMLEKHCMCRTRDNVSLVWRIPALGNMAAWNQLICAFHRSKRGFGRFTFYCLYLGNHLDNHRCVTTVGLTCSLHAQGCLPRGYCIEPIILLEPGRRISGSISLAMEDGGHQ